MAAMAADGAMPAEPPQRTEAAPGGVQLGSAAPAWARNAAQ
jgi:hypothetical protein